MKRDWEEFLFPFVVGAVIIAAVTLLVIMGLQ
jgi:uncharacterized protein (DUF2062 family)